MPSCDAKRKILIVTTNAGFITKFEMNDVRILLEYGYEVHYASNFREPVYEFDAALLERMGLILHPIPIKKSPKDIIQNVRAYKALRKIIRDEGINFVHCHNPIGGVLGRLASHAQKREKRPYVIYTAHGFHFYDGAPKKNWMIYYPVEKWLAKYTDRIITINTEDFNRASSFRLKKGGCVNQIHGVGVDTERFRKKEGAYEREREKLGIPKDAFHIVSVAELNANKNQKVIIEAMMKLCNPHIHFTICGKGVAPRISTENLLDSLRRSYIFPDQIHLLGYRNDIDEILQSADLFAFPSYREGLGVAAVEAMACGVPVIAADNRGTKEYMTGEESVYVCPAGDVDAFAGFIKDLYSNHEMRLRVGKAATQIAQHFSIQNTDRVMRKIYREIG